jgi:type II secretory pathway component HofQ
MVHRVTRLRRQLRLLLTVTLAAMLVACAASRSFMRGEQAAHKGDWDQAVEYYRQAVQDDPDRADYKIAYERATFAAANLHLDRARKAEEEARLDEALREYRRAVELDSTNRQAAAKAGEIEKVLRDRLEASRPRPEIERLREEARKQAPEPLLSPTSPLGPVRFQNANARDVLNFIGESTGINVIFDRDFPDRTISINVEGVTLEQALQQIMLTNQMFYKVLNDRTILVIQDTTAKRTQFEDQVVRTFFLSHADATEMLQLLNGIIRVAGVAVQPQFIANKTTNTLTARASTALMAIIEKMLESNDKPRAEVIIDVQILEVSRERAKQYGLNLSAYQIGGIFSPEVAPTTGTTGTTTPPFNLNTISQGVSTADFYMSVPSAVFKFLESDSRTKVLAKPQLRGTEGQKVSLNLGEDTPIPQTTFTPLATGGAAANPLTSFGYRTIGIIVEMTPRVTYEGDIVLDVTVENSARGGDVIIAGQALPAFSSRKVTTRLRLRDGEPNLLAGLLREYARKSLKGFPGVLRLPVIQQLFSANDSTIRQTDIVMMLTPRIVRSHELTATDLAPIYIGPQSNFSLGSGPPPLINVPAEPPVSGVIGGPPPPTPGVTLTFPAGSTPVPGLQSTPPAPAGTTPPGTTTPPPPATPSTVVTIPPGAVTPVPAPTTAGPPQPVAPTQPAPPPAAPAAPAAPPRDPSQPPAPSTAVTPPAAAGGGGRVSIAAPAEMRVGGGPYTVPISISGASRLSTISLSVTYNPALLRVRSVQEGTFMRQGGVAPAFTNQVDSNTGRIDIAITRPGDQTGAVGNGLLAAILFEPVTAGSATLNVAGVGTVAGTNAAAALQFAPAAVVIK